MERHLFVFERFLHILKMCIFAVGIKRMHPHGGNYQRIIKNDTRHIYWSEVSHPSHENLSDAE